MVWSGTLIHGMIPSFIPLAQVSLLSIKDGIMTGASLHPVIGM